jgi:cell division protease FtsH
MSLKLLDPKDRQSESQRHAWEDEETLVQQRRKFRYKILRLLNPWRILLVVIIAALLMDASVMTFFLGTLLPLLLQLSTAGIAIGFQLFVMFWFLGRARMYTIWPGQEGVTFDDYRGQPELLEQARQIVKLLRGVKVFEDAGGEPLNGLLLEGPPGTGKTWLAQAISTEAGVPFFFVDASSLSSAFIGIAPIKVSRMYGRARRAARDYGASIVFIDELDAIGARSGMASGSQSANKAPSPFADPNHLPMMMGMGMGGGGILSTLLIEMSGFSLEHGFWARKRTWFYKTFLRRNPPKPQKRVLTIGATNRIGALDAALLRPGRFDKKIHVDAPDMEGRREIFEYYLSKMAHDETMDPLILASETAHYTPADIKYLLNEALRYALFDGRTYISYRDFRLAQPEHETGLRSPIKTMLKEDKYRLAAHEAGHAVGLRVFVPEYRISRITIIRQGGALGHVSFHSALEEYDYMGTQAMLLNRLRMALGGRAGEMEWEGPEAQMNSVGGDFPAVRKILYDMARVGMFGTLGISKPQAKEVEKMMEEAFLIALDDMRLALRTHRTMWAELVELLMERDELLADEVEAFFDKYGFHTPKPQLLVDHLKTKNGSKDDTPGGADVTDGIAAARNGTANGNGRTASKHQPAKEAVKR